MNAVIDASALLRLFLQDGPSPEGLVPLLEEVEQGESQALAPQLLLAESANVLRKKCLQGVLSPAETENMLRELQALGIQFMDHQPLMANSLKLALEWKLTVYDSLYLELALQHESHLFTCDQKLQETYQQLHQST